MPSPHSPARLGRFHQVARGSKRLCMAAELSCRFAAISRGSLWYERELVQKTCQEALGIEGNARRFQLTFKAGRSAFPARVSRSREPLYGRPGG